MAKSTKGGTQGPPKNANEVLKLVKEEDIKTEFRK